MCHAFWAHRRPVHSFSPGSSHSQPGHWPWEGFMSSFPGEEGFGAGGGFGVRRPLRFLAHKLELDEKQVVSLARILDEQFDGAKAAAAGERRVESGKRLRATLVRSLEQIHALLNAEQRARLAHLIRTGVLAV